MFETRGPCCDWHDKNQVDVKARLRVGYTMLQGNPRFMIMWGEAMKKQIGSHRMREGLSGDPCPCNEAPDPKKFREFARFLMDKKAKGLKVSNPVEGGVVLGALAEEFKKTQKF